MLRWWNRLSFKILLLIVLLALLPLLGFGLFATQAASMALRNQIRLAHLAVAYQAVDITERAVENLQQNLDITSQRRVFGTSAYHNQEYALQTLLQTFSEIKAVTVLNGQGDEKLKLSRSEIFQANDLVSRAETPMFVQAIQGQRYIGPVQTSTAGEPYLVIAVPIRSPDRSEVIGVLAAEVSLRNLLSRLSSLKIDQTGYVVVVDSRGRVIAHPDHSLVLAEADFSDHPHVAHFLMGDSTDEMHQYTNDANEALLVVAAVSPALGWIVLVEQNAAEALVAARLMTTALSITMAVVLAAVLAIAGYMLWHLTRALQSLEQGAEMIGRGELDYQIPVVSNDEVGRVTTTFNKMAADLQDSYHQLAAKNEELRRSSISRYLMGQILDDLKTEAPLREGQMFMAGVRLAGRVEAENVHSYLQAFTQLGLGELCLDTVDEENGLYCFVGVDLPESADPSTAPRDDFTRGYLCGVVSRLQGDRPVASTETECQGMGDAYCRFYVRPLADRENR
jgi:methyl-accepting chemotaxis protein